WHGAFRFRMFLKGVKVEAGEQPDNNLRILEFKKNQYGPLGEDIVVRYEHGVYRLQGGASAVDKIVTEQKAKDVFLVLLQRFDQAQQKVNDNSCAHNYAPKIFAAEKEARDAGLKKEHLITAMKDLFREGKVKNHTYGKASDPRTQIVASAS